MTDTAKEIEQFIDTIWADAEGYVYLPTKDSRTDTWKKTFFEWPAHRDKVTKYILAMSSRGLDVYIAPAIFAKPNPKKEYVLGSYVLWTEFDGNAPTGWQGEDVYGTPDAIQPRAKGIPEPTLRVQSSNDGHEHVYWKLDEFTTDIGWVESANRSIAYETHADTSGWDRNQILRPPGSRNYKHDLPVTIIKADESVYNRTAFKALKPPKQLVDDSIDTENLPSVTRIIAKYKWDDEEFEFFQREEIPQGERSFALMRIGYIGAELGMTDQEIYSILIDADNRWGKFKNRDDRKRRLLDVIDRARQKHPVGLEELTFRGLLETTPGETIELNTQVLYRFKDFLESEIEVEWLIEDLLEAGGFGMVAGKPGVGKTQMTLQMGICCALGIPFLGWAIPSPLKVVFLSLEMSQVALKKFLDTISTGYDATQHDILQENFYLVPLGEALPLARRGGLDFLENLLGEVQPDLILIDSMNKVSKGVLNEESVNELNRILIKVRNKYGCAFQFVHHNRKENGDNKKPTSLDDIYGSVFITAEMTNAMILWHDGAMPKNIVDVIPVKSRLAELREPFTTVRDPLTLKFTVTDEIDPDTFMKEPDADNITALE